MMVLWQIVMVSPDPAAGARTQRRLLLPVGAVMTLSHRRVDYGFTFTSR